MSFLPLIEIDAFIEQIHSSNKLIDVRAPIEFASAKFPFCENLPILTDSEREQVGTTYRHSGPDSAKELGHKLVAAEIKQARVQSWLTHIEDYSNCAIFCARGGLRSEITQQWLADAGVVVPRIRGGYKAMRNFLLEQLELHCSSLSAILVSGNTGSGKTRLLHQVQTPSLPPIDLEHIANHRGSAFGSIGLQPAQATFENDLSFQLLKLATSHPSAILIESESRSIGKNWLPAVFTELMNVSPCVELKVAIQTRVMNIIDEYIVEPLSSYSGELRDKQIEQLQQNLGNSVRRIEKRLGGNRTQEIISLLDEAMSQYTRDNSPTVHSNWVHCLLEWYYDPLYNWHFEKQTSTKVLYSGDYDEVIGYLQGTVAKRNSRPA